MVRPTPAAVNTPLGLKGAALALVSTLSALALAPRAALACTNLIVGRGVSASNATVYAYNADEGALYGSLGHYPATQNPPGTLREVWDWDSSVYLGALPEASSTLAVSGNANAAGLVIGETTFGGIEQLDGGGHGHVVDYGSLIWITLQRAEGAMEAIELMDNLTATHGYASSGESFSIVDPGGDAWLLELIGKGKERGTVWVATKVPDTAVLAHANQARTTTFLGQSADGALPCATLPQARAMSEAKRAGLVCLYAADVVDFAVAQGLYPASAPQEGFDFSAVYDPLTFGGVRHGDARVWDIYRRLAPGQMQAFEAYARGSNITGERIPLFLYPEAPLGIEDAMELMRTRFESTWFDMSGTDRDDVGAGAGNAAYRRRPLSWQSGGKGYVNERPVGVQQTAWNFVAAVRPRMPPPLRALQWWAPDDSASALRVPVYGGATRVPYNFRDPVGQDPAAATPPTIPAPQADAYRMSMDSAFWVWNLVAAFSYGNRGAQAYERIYKALVDTQSRLLARADKADEEALGLWETGDEHGAVEHATSFMDAAGADAFERWTQLFYELFASYRDGFSFGEADLPQCGPGETKGCTSRYVPHADEDGYSDEWYARIVRDGDNAEHYSDLTPSSAGFRRDRLEEAKRRVLDGKRVRPHAAT